MKKKDKTEINSGEELKVAWKNYFQEPLNENGVVQSEKGGSNEQECKE